MTADTKTTNISLGRLVLQAIILSISLLAIYTLTSYVKTFVNLPPFYHDLIKNLLKVAFIISAGWITLQLINLGEAKLYQQLLVLEKKKHIRMNSAYTKVKVIRNIISFVVAAITLAFVLMNFNIVKNIGVSLLASAGFATALIGLAAQKTLSTLFTGIQLAATQQIKIGDMIYFDSTRGTVEEITFAHVTIKLSDTKRMIVPASYFLDKPFQNWSRGNEGLKDYVYINVDWRVSIQSLREHFTEILNQSTHWNKKTGTLQVDQLGEYSVKIYLYVSAANYDALCSLKNELKEKMHDYITATYPNYLPTVPLKMAS